MAKSKKFHYTYKTTNTITNRYYFGMHSCSNIDDNYLGSGTILQRSIRKHGKKNHTKQILQYYSTREDLQTAERTLITEHHLTNPNCMNLMPGGQGMAPGMVIVRDSVGDTCMISVDDPRYVSGELQHVSRGRVTVKDKCGASSQVATNDPRYTSGELVPITTGMVPVKDSDGNTSQVAITDPRYVSGELVHINVGTVVVKDHTGDVKRVATDDPNYQSGEFSHIMKGMMTVKDQTGKTCSIDTTDPRCASGELVHAWSGSTHSNETKRKMSASHKKNHHQQGTSNSQYGKVWIYSLTERVSKRIPTSKLADFTSVGWVKGRKMKFE